MILTLEYPEFTGYDKFGLTVETAVVTLIHLLFNVDFSPGSIN